MGEGPREEDIAELQSEVRRLREQVAALQTTLARVGTPIVDAVDQLERMRDVAGNYFRLLELYQRNGVISPEAVLPELKDPISVEIVRVLFDQGNLNVSEITDRVRARRGTASRTVVRDRLQTLVGARIVVREGDTVVGRYRISDDIVERWYRLIGLRR
jgi:DNA-binding transcriptional ArsR family regulator